MPKSILKKTPVVESRSESDNNDLESNGSGSESDNSDLGSKGSDDSSDEFHGNESYDEVEDEEIDQMLQEIEDNTRLSEVDENSLKKGQPRKNKKLLLGQDNQQYNFAKVMESIINKKNAINEEKLLINSTKDEILPKISEKRKSNAIDNDASSEEKIDIISSEAKKFKTCASSRLPGQLRFPIMKKRDPFCQNPAKETNVMKEKRLRTRATQGVMQLFNALEEFKKPSGEVTTRPGASIQLGKKTEISAITTGKSGLLDFLTKKQMPADRQLFSEQA